MFLRPQILAVAICALPLLFGVRVAAQELSCWLVTRLQEASNSSYVIAARAKASIKPPENPFRLPPSAPTAGFGARLGPFDPTRELRFVLAFDRGFRTARSPSTVVDSNRCSIGDSRRPAPSST